MFRTRASIVGLMWAVLARIIQIGANEEPPIYV